MPMAQVGMQNSALGAVLASLHFADPLTPIPGAISACAKRRTLSSSISPVSPMSKFKPFHSVTMRIPRRLSSVRHEIQAAFAAPRCVQPSITRRVCRSIISALVSRPSALYQVQAPVSIASIA